MKRAITQKPARDLTAFKELQSFSVYVNLFSQTEINGTTRSVFKIIVEDNISHHKYLGYCLEKNKNNIDIFVSYVLSNLEMRGGLDKNYKLITGRGSAGYENKADSGLPKVKKHKVIKNSLSHKEILSRIYKELIFNDGYAEMEGYSETKNPLLPPLFIDSFIRDFDKVFKFTDYWRNQKMSGKDNSILKETLIEAGHEVEEYQNKFDFENALKFYKRLSSAAAELAGSEKISAQFLLKQVKIYFHLEQYDKCRDLIEANIRNLEKFKMKDELGELYYYLGMMCSYSNKVNEADAFFAGASRMLSKSKEPEKVVIYYRSRIKRYVIKKDYEHAVTLVNEAVRFAFKLDSIKALGQLYGLKAEIYIRNGKYGYALENLNIQLEYAKKANDLISESKCISQMFLVFSYLGNFDNRDVAGYLRRIKKLAKTINKNSYYYSSLISHAIFLYKSDRFDQAEKYFKKALIIYTSDTTNAAKHIINMIYLSKIRIMRKNYLSAVRLLNKMLKLCANSNVSIYPAYIENLLGRIYSERKILAESNIHLKKALKYIKDGFIKDKILLANTHKYLGLNYSELYMNNLAIKNLNVSLNILSSIINDPDVDLCEVISGIKSKIAMLTHGTPV